MKLHESMVRGTLDWAQRLCQLRSVNLEVHVSGASPATFQKHFALSPDFANCLPQRDGDLGTRLATVARQALADSIHRIIFVGTDCPELDDSIALQALHRLSDHDVCLVPAKDGGYALLAINLNQLPTPKGLDALFQGIDWGTSKVFDQTIDNLLAANIPRIALLPSLHDIDRPEDLLLLDDLPSQPANSDGLSILIPCVDEEPALKLVLERAADGEKIVVASGRIAQTLRVCRDQGSHFIYHDGSRAAKQNAAAACSSGEFLLFLHADTLLPEDYNEQIRHCLSNEKNVAGAFRLKIDSPQMAARFVELGVQLRSRWRQLPYGDQALFLPQPVFQAVGGFPDQPIMEDYELVRRLRVHGKIAIASSAVTTSDRRWKRLGYFRTTLVNQRMLAGYHLGYPIDGLAKFYRSL